jgi:hypothetical protein
MTPAPAAASRVEPADSGSMGLDPDFDARWAAWQRRGVAQERAGRVKLMIGAPIAVALAGLIWYLVSGQ